MRLRRFDLHFYIQRTLLSLKSGLLDPCRREDCRCYAGCTCIQPCRAVLHSYGQCSRRALHKLLLTCSVLWCHRLWRKQISERCRVVRQGSCGGGRSAPENTVLIPWTSYPQSPSFIVNVLESLESNWQPFVDGLTLGFILTLIWCIIMFLSILY